MATDEMMPVVHLLFEGRALCLFSLEVPANWPPLHKWVWLVNKSEATCTTCLARTGWIAPEPGVLTRDLIAHRLDELRTYLKNGAEMVGRLAQEGRWDMVRAISLQMASYEFARHELAMVLEAFERERQHQPVTDDKRAKA